MSNEADGEAVDLTGHRPTLSRRGFLGGAVVAAATAGPSDLASGAEPTRGGVDVNPRLHTFVGGKTGAWAVVEINAVVGDTLPAVERLDVVNGIVAAPADGGIWILRGVTSNERYVDRGEKDRLVAKQVALGRPEADRAVLIPIRKNSAWWSLTQAERRAIFEERSRHVAIGLKYLPAIARRLHHCRDLGEAELFDFLTLFDYAEKDASAFEDLVAALRATEEWKFVDREVDIRLERVRT